VVWVAVQAINPLGGQGSTTTGNGIWFIPAIARYIRARVSTYTSGTVAGAAAMRREAVVNLIDGLVTLGTSSSNIGWLMRQTHFDDTNTPMTAAQTVTGTTRDAFAASSAATAYTAFGLRAILDQACTIRLEYSWDGTNFYKAKDDEAFVPAVAGTPQTVSREIDIIGRYVRFTLINGATAQGVTRVATRILAK
jgi:hypothetical protein